MSLLLECHGLARPSREGGSQKNHGLAPSDRSQTMAPTDDMERIKG